MITDLQPEGVFVCGDTLDLISFGIVGPICGGIGIFDALRNAISLNPGRVDIYSWKTMEIS